MTYKVELRPAARRALRKLPTDARRRVEIAILALAEDPRPPGCKSLSGRLGQYRVRVGDYRVIYIPRDSQLLILVVDVGHRRDIYR